MLQLKFHNLCKSIKMGCNFNELHPRCIFCYITCQDHALAIQRLIIFEVLWVNISSQNVIWHYIIFEDREKCPSYVENGLFWEYISKRNSPIILDPTCQWTGVGGSLQRFCSCELTDPLTGLGSEADRGVLLLICTIIF